MAHARYIKTTPVIGSGAYNIAILVPEEAEQHKLPARRIDGSSLATRGIKHLAYLVVALGVPASSGRSGISIALTSYSPHYTIQAVQV